MKENQNNKLSVFKLSILKGFSLTVDLIYGGYGLHFTAALLVVS
jgi:hypothetical protein